MDSGKAVCCCVPYCVLVHYEYLSYYNYNDHTLFYFYCVLLSEHLAPTLFFFIFDVFLYFLIFFKSKTFSSEMDHRKYIFIFVSDIDI